MSSLTHTEHCAQCDDAPVRSVLTHAPVRSRVCFSAVGGRSAFAAPVLPQSLSVRPLRPLRAGASPSLFLTTGWITTRPGQWLLPRRFLRRFHRLSLRLCLHLFLYLCMIQYGWGSLLLLVFSSSVVLVLVWIHVETMIQYSQEVPRSFGEDLGSEVVFCIDVGHVLDKELRRHENRRHPLRRPRQPVLLLGCSLPLLRPTPPCLRHLCFLNG